MEAEASVSNGVQPNTISYSSVIDAWSNSVAIQKRDPAGQLRSAEQAEKVLKRMFHLYEQKKNVKPNVVSFTSCIKAWSRCNHPSAPNRAEKLFSKLVELFDQTKDNDFRPTIQTGTVLATAWARALSDPTSMDHAEYAL